jgi:hypothetical protein
MHHPCGSMTDEIDRLAPVEILNTVSVSVLMVFMWRLRQRFGCSGTRRGQRWCRQRRGGRCVGRGEGWRLQWKERRGATALWEKRNVNR